MFKHLLLTTTAILCLLTNSYSNDIIYVKQGAKGIGSSWADATGDLQHVLTNAKPGTEIWIAEGTYYPTKCNSCKASDRSISFVIPTGVKLIGGFQGNEKRFTQRDWQKHPTKLSGNIGRPGPLDNSYSVVYMSNANKETVLDGLIIADGQADAPVLAGHPARSGGGLYNDGAGIGNESNPMLLNCIFLNNFALEGGALFNNGDYGNGSPAIVDCTFTNNKALNSGGAIYNNGQNGTSDPLITYSQFVNNESVFGAGIFNTCPEKNTNPKIFNCTFANNKTQQGGCLFFLGLSEGPKLRTVTFVNNLSDNDEDISVMNAKVIPNGLMAEMPLDEGEF